MTDTPRFLNLTQHAADRADVALLPLPYEATVSYGRGTAGGPAAIWAASAEGEEWEEETGFDLTRLALHNAPPVKHADGEAPADYLARVTQAAEALHGGGPLVFGVGGEHSLTPALLEAAVRARGMETARGITVVQFDAHADLRDAYHGTPFSHACAMRRCCDLGADVLAIGIRSAERDEAQWGRDSGRVTTYYMHELARDKARRASLRAALASQLTGPVYLTVDIDVMDPVYCPGTGTPQPGGLDWWGLLELLRALLIENSRIDLVGCDLCEVAPLAGQTVGEFTAARLIMKMLGYRYSRRP